MKTERILFNKRMTYYSLGYDINKSIESYGRRLQESLPAIRVVAGVSPSVLSAALGISETTLINIEKHPEKMTIVYFWAIYITLCNLAIAEQIEDHDPLLLRVINILISDSVPNDVRKKLIDAILNVKNSIDIHNGYHLIKAKVRKEIRSLVDELSPVAKIASLEF